MGERKGLKVVLDTNILISILLFGGRLESIRKAWKEGKIQLIFCPKTLEELIKVLHYPKLGLTEEEITYLVEVEILPYAVLIEKTTFLDPSLIRDKDDLKFLECALSGKADYLVSGDKDVLEVKKFQTPKVLSAKGFLEILEKL